eukprot:3878902-Pleurochrysis_carterae.AAC.3
MYRHKREYTSKSATNTQERLVTSEAWAASGSLQHNEYKQNTAEDKSRQQAVIKSGLLQALFEFSRERWCPRVGKLTRPDGHRSYPRENTVYSHCLCDRQLMA